MFPASPQARARPARCRAGLAALVVLALSLAHPISRAQQTLSLDQALRTAQERSRQLPAQDAAAAAARERAIAAGQRPDPTLKVGINNLPIDTQDRFSLTRDFMTMRSIGVMQEITRSDKLQARSVRFERDAAAAEAARSLALATLRRDTALAWLDCHYLERMQGILQSQRSEAGLQVEAADAAYRGGRGAQADVFAARSAVAWIDDRLRQAGQQIATARTRLARWVGAAAEQPLQAPPPLASLHLDVQELESRLDHHPQIAVLARQEEMARAEADLVRSNQRADWSVELMFSQRGPAYSNMVSVNLSVPLQLNPAHRQDRELAAGLATVEQLRAQREEATREHLAEVRGWLQAWQSGLDRLSHHDSTLLPLADQRTQVALSAYRGGTGTLGSVLEARRLEIDARMERLRLEMDTAGHWARLNTLLPPGPDRTENGP